VPHLKVVSFGVSCPQITVSAVFASVFGIHSQNRTLRHGLDMTSLVESSAVLPDFLRARAQARKIRLHTSQQVRLSRLYCAEGNDGPITPDEDISSAASHTKVDSPSRSVYTSASSDPSSSNTSTNPVLQCSSVLLQDTDLISSRKRYIKISHVLARSRFWGSALLGLCTALVRTYKLSFLLGLLAFCVFQGALYMSFKVLDGWFRRCRAHGVSESDNPKMEQALEENSSRLFPNIPLRAEVALIVASQVLGYLMETFRFVSDMSVFIVTYSVTLSVNSLFL